MLISALSVLLAAGTITTSDDAAVHLTPMTKGASAEVGGYRPVQATLAAERPAEITKIPEGLTAPMYAKLAIANDGGKPIHILLDEPDGKPAKLFIDSNGDGDLTNDPAAEWEGKERPGPDGKTLTMYSGNATVQIGTADKPFEASLGLYRFDKNDPQRAQLKSVVLYYRDYGLRGEVKLGDKTYKALLVDDRVTGDFRGDADSATTPAGSGVTMMLDVNNNGKFDRRGEMFDVRKPFKLGGVAYEISEMAKNGQSFKIVKSDKHADEVAPPPDHGIGKKITAFEAKLMDGKTIKFPGDYKGKVVLLDFWATWCGPCMAEAPNVVATYDKFHGKGFEVLGVSLDKENAEDKIKQVTGKVGMAWPQVYDGKFWQAEVAQTYAIDSIPATYLVDGDTGEVLAVGARGPKLGEAVEKALAQKAKN